MVRQGLRVRLKRAIGELQSAVVVESSPASFSAGVHGAPLASNVVRHSVPSPLVMQPIVVSSLHSESVTHREPAFSTIWQVPAQ